MFFRLTPFPPPPPQIWREAGYHPLESLLFFFFLILAGRIRVCALYEWVLWLLAVFCQRCLFTALSDVFVFLAIKHPELLREVVTASVQSGHYCFSGGFFSSHATPFPWKLDAEKSFHAYELYEYPFLVTTGKCEVCNMFCRCRL
jgi:hypothetical protein